MHSRPWPKINALMLWQAVVVLRSMQWQERLTVASKPVLGSPTDVVVQSGTLKGLIQRSFANSPKDDCQVKYLHPR